jgi:hypothetical protein
MTTKASFSFFTSLFSGSILLPFYFPNISGNSQNAGRNEYRQIEKMRLGKIS